MSITATELKQNLGKYLHNTEQAKGVMLKLFELFGILDVMSDDCRDASLLEVNDYEDAVRSCCAVRNHIDYIVTRNIKDYEKSKVQAIFPSQLIKMVSQDGI